MGRRPLSLRGGLPRTTRRTQETTRLLRRPTAALPAPPRSNNSPDGDSCRVPALLSCTNPIPTGKAHPTRPALARRPPQDVDRRPATYQALAPAAAAAAAAPGTADATNNDKDDDSAKPPRSRPRAGRPPTRPQRPHLLRRRRRGSARRPTPRILLITIRQPFSATGIILLFCHRRDFFPLYADLLGPTSLLPSKSSESPTRPPLSFPPKHPARHFFSITFAPPTFSTSSPPSPYLLRSRPPRETAPASPRPLPRLSPSRRHLPPPDADRPSAPRLHFSLALRTLLPFSL